MEAFHGKVFTADISVLEAWGISLPNILALFPASGCSKEHEYMSAHNYFLENLV